MKGKKKEWNISYYHLLNNSISATLAIGYIQGRISGTGKRIFIRCIFLCGSICIGRGIAKVPFPGIDKAVGGSTFIGKNKRVFITGSNNIKITLKPRENTNGNRIAVGTGIDPFYYKLYSIKTCIGISIGWVTFCRCICAP